MRPQTNRTAKCAVGLHNGSATTARTHLPLGGLPTRTLITTTITTTTPTTGGAGDRKKHQFTKLKFKNIYTFSFSIYNC